MKKILGVASAALLLSVSGASASTKTTNLSIDVSFGGFSTSCPLTITQTTDHKRISSQILLTAQSGDCSFIGGGLIGAADNTGSTPLTSIATISGYSDLAHQYADVGNLTVLLQLTPDGRFKNNLKYSVYASFEDGSGNLLPQQYIGGGKYTINK